MAYTLHARLSEVYSRNSTWTRDSDGSTWTIVRLYRNKEETDNEFIDCFGREPFERDRWDIWADGRIHLTPRYIQLISDSFSLDKWVEEFTPIYQ